MKNLRIVNNPVIDDALSYLRSKTTDMKMFRYYSDRICDEMISAVIDESDLAPVEIETALMKTAAKRNTNSYIVISILRSAIAMVPSILKILPGAKIGFAGLARNEKTSIAYEYYWKVPPITDRDLVVIIDPMLATGGSVLHVLHKIQSAKPKKIRVASIISAPEGVRAIHEEYPDVVISTAALDSSLNARKYILPGLGDFGDRFFGTENE